GLSRPGAKKRFWIEMLTPCAVFVHVSGGRVVVGLSAGLFRSLWPDFFAPANQTSADDPEILGLAGRHIDGDRHRPVAPVRTLQVIPGFFRLDDMGIGVYR